MHVICDVVMVTYDIGPSLSPFVARVHREIESWPSVVSQLTPMGTVIEGELSDILQLVDHLFSLFGEQYERLGLTIKIDYRRSKQSNRISGKVASVLEKSKR